MWKSQVSGPCSPKVVSLLRRHLVKARPIATRVEYTYMTSDETFARVEDLRFALSVMEEHSHLGLDSEYASKLRSLMLRQIAETEQDLGTVANLRQ